MPITRSCAREGCEKSLAGKAHNALFCSPACRRETRRQDYADYQRAYYLAHREELQSKQQGRRAQNGEELRARQREESRRSYARHADRRLRYSSEWKRQNPDKVRDYSAARRATKVAAVIEPVDRQVVWERDGGICHICHQDADPTDWHLDHVIPLVKGGQHSYANVAVSHPFCNLSKGARLLILTPS